MSNGSNVINISISKLGRLVEMTPLGAAFIDKRYFMSFGGTLYPSNELFPSDDLYPGTALNADYNSLQAGIIIIDMSGQSPIFSTIVDTDIGYVYEAEETLFQIATRDYNTSNYVTENGVSNIVTEDGKFNITAETSESFPLSETFNGEELRRVNYRSPLLTEGSIGVFKQYEKVRITYRGTLKIVISNDKHKILQTAELFSAGRVSEWVSIPVAYNKGYGIAFSLVGKCIVDSLLYTWTPKESQ